MHAATVLVTLSFIAFVLYCVLRSPKIKRDGKALKKPPNSLPLLGNGILFLQARHKLFSWFVKCEREFGFETFQISVPTLPPGVVINDPTNLEYVLKNEGIFAKGDFFKRRSWDLFGNGIINADGDLWKVQRKAGLHFLNTANLKVLTDVALPQYLRESIQDLRRAGQSIVDLEIIFHELTTQIMGKMAYDMEIHNSHPFSEAFDYASGATGERFQNPIWQITEPFFGRRFRSSVSIVKKFGSVIVSKAVQSRQNSIITRADNTKISLGSTSGSLINSLLDSIQDEKMVADAALNYLSAGRDTTAQALTWTFYLLMRHPEVLETLRRDIVALVQENKMTNDTEPLNTTIFRPVALPYATAVFYETLRFYPPVPFELKQCQKSTTLPDGTHLPNTSIVLWCTWAMNRSKLIWGDDADSFRPERWLDNGVFISRSAFEYPVFNGGPRTCLGKKMAEIVGVQVIASFVLEFQFNPVDSKERISKNSLTLPMEGGLPCRVKSRDHFI